MERYSKTYFRQVGYKVLMEQGWTHDQIAKADVNSIKTEILLESTGRIRTVGLRIDSHFLENMGRNALGFEMLNSTVWEVPMY